MGLKRLTYNKLMVEITRRCNMNCAHCFRGDAQNIDMSHETIDSLLEKTNAIYTLEFTGGEPLLNLDGMRYFLESAKSHEVLLNQIKFITNGTVQGDEVISLVRDYNEYISQFKIASINAKSLIDIRVSVDDYHDAGAEKRFQWYQNNLGEYATIGRAGAGKLPYSIGRASRLPYALEPTRPAPTRIIYRTGDNIPICLEAASAPLLHPRQVIILCGLYISATGKVLSGHYAFYSFDEEKEVPYVFSVYESSAQDILNLIDRYNFGKRHCVLKSYDFVQQALKQPRQAEIQEVLDYVNLFVKAKKAPDRKEYIFSLMVKYRNNPYILKRLQREYQHYHDEKTHEEILEQVLELDNAVVIDESLEKVVAATPRPAAAEIENLIHEALAVEGREKYGSWYDYIEQHTALTDDQKDMLYKRINSLVTYRLLLRCNNTSEKRQEYNNKLSEIRKNIKHFYTKYQPPGGVDSAAALAQLDSLVEQHLDEGHKWAIEQLKAREAKNKTTIL